jgi:hypothetical protein
VQERQKHANKRRAVSWRSYELGVAVAAEARKQEESSKLEELRVRSNSSGRSTQTRGEQ